MDADSMHTKGDSTPITPAPKPETTPEPHVETATTSQAAEPEMPTAEAAVEPVTPAPSEPVTQQNQPTEPAPQTTAPLNSAGTITLQWLTYAFWGWLMAALVWLTSVVLVNGLVNRSTDTVVPYAIAASVVLLPLAFVCDLFYRKHEPVKKAGSAMVIMVIHAVLFALLSIVSLITAVFIGINLSISTYGSNSEQVAALLTALTSAILFAGVFLRTLNPTKSKKLAAIYAGTMLGLTILLLVLGAAGPLVKSIATRGDRLIENALPSVHSAIDEYISENDKLPASLDDVTFSAESAQELVDDGKVEYIPGAKVAKSLNNLTSSYNTYRYQLCVTYKAEANGGSTRYYSSNDGYSSGLSTYGHGAGRTCYKLQQTAYGSN